MLSKIVELDGKMIAHELTGTENYEENGFIKKRFSFKRHGTKVNLEDLMKMPSRTFYQDNPNDNPESKAIQHGISIMADYIKYENKGSLQAGYVCEAEYYYIRK